jgi:thiol-disulfide isomerase/thioredoxin
MEENIKELDDKTFDETLKSTDKLVIVEFYTNTCPNCLAIAPVYEELSKELSEDAVFAQLNAQKNMANLQILLQERTNRRVGWSDSCYCPEKYHKRPYQTPH